MNFLLLCCEGVPRSIQNCLHLHGWQINKSRSDGIVMRIVVCFDAFFSICIPYIWMLIKFSRKSLVEFFVGVRIWEQNPYKLLLSTRITMASATSDINQEKKCFKERKKRVYSIFGRMKNGLFVFKWSTNMFFMLQTKKDREKTHLQCQRLKVSSSSVQFVSI